MKEGRQRNYGGEFWERGQWSDVYRERSPRERLGMVSVRRGISRAGMLKSPFRREKTTVCKRRPRSTGRSTFQRGENQRSLTSMEKKKEAIKGKEGGTGSTSIDTCSGP